MSLLSLLVLTGGLATAFNIAALGIGAAMVGKWPQTVIIRLCLLAAAGATACFLISLENFGLLPKTASLVQTEIVLTLAAGPLLFLVLSALAGTDGGLRRFAVLVALTLAGVTLTEIMTGSADIRHAVLVQMGWTLFAAWHVRHAVRGQGRSPLFTRMLRALLLAMVIIHLAQILRMSFPDVAMMRAALPLGFALAFVLGAMMAALVPVRDGRARLDTVPKTPISSFRRPSACALRASAGCRRRKT